MGSTPGNLDSTLSHASVTPYSAYIGTGEIFASSAETWL